MTSLTALTLVDMPLGKVLPHVFPPSQIDMDELISRLKLLSPPNVGVNLTIQSQKYNEMNALLMKLQSGAVNIESDIQKVLAAGFDLHKSWQLSDHHPMHKSYLPHLTSVYLTKYVLLFFLFLSLSLSLSEF